MAHSVDNVELETLVQYFEDAEDSSRDARFAAEKSRDYVDNIQWTSDEKKALQARRQPVVTFNLVGPKVDFLQGIERQSRTDPKAFPRTPNHDDAADAATDALRYVLDNQDFDELASEVFDNLTVEGTGGAVVGVEKQGDDIAVTIEQIRWDRFGADPHSAKKDYSDANYTFIIAWKEIAEAKEKWGDKADELESAMNATPASDTYDDKPIHWYDSRRKRVMCVDMYFVHKGQWHHAIFGRDVWLEGPEVSTYVDEDNVPQNAHVVRSVKVKRDLQRYGLVEAWLDPQDVVNKTRSKATHILNTKQTFAKEGMVEDINAFKREANKPDGHLEFPGAGEFGKDFGLIPNEGLSPAHFSMYLDAVNRLDSMGANDSMAGRDDRELSGKAVRSIQQGDMRESFYLFDSHAQWKKKIYKAVWERVRQFWREEKWVRVTDDEDNLKFVGLNIPVTLAEQNISDQLGIPVKEVKERFADELQQMYQMQPELQETVNTENLVAEIEVDIILEDVPDVVNLQSEQFDLLVKMYTAAPDKIDFNDIIEMSSLRNKKKFTGKELTPEQQQQLQQKQEREEQVVQMGLEDQQAKTAKTRTEAMQNIAKIEQTEVETELLITAPAPTKVAVI